MNIREVVDQCARDSHAWFPERAHDVPFLTLALCGEVGELANLIKKVERGTDLYTELKSQIVEEGTDAFIYLCTLFHALGADLEVEYSVKRSANARRFGSDPTAASGGGPGIPGCLPATVVEGGSAVR